MAKSDPALSRDPAPAPDPDPTPRGRFDASEAVILWNEPGRRIARVAVIGLPATRLPPDHPVWARWRDVASGWDHVFGAISPGWMASDQARPETVFAYFLLAGFAGAGEETRAYAQFARIRGCDWTRHGPARPGPDARRLNEAARSWIGPLGEVQMRCRSRRFGRDAKSSDG